MLKRKAASMNPSVTSEPDQIPSPSGTSKWKSFRPKRIIGRIVPLVLLLYVYHAYNLVVIEFGYKHRIQTQGQLIFGTFYLIIAHLLFFVSLFNYVRIFFSSHEHDSKSGLGSKLGTKIPATPFEPPASLQDGSLLFQCSSDGSPLRCFRDSCNGRWKPPRSRHCGDCRTCLPALDHHCAWFDSNISAPKTMFPFVIFLIFVLALYFWSFIPLLPIAVKHTRAIWRFGKTDQRVRSIWWERKLTWVGGPFFRWIIGWIIAGYHIPVKRVDPSNSLTISSPNLRAPFVVFTGLMLILVAGALLAATLVQIKNGDLSVDVERRKAFYRIMMNNPKLAKSLSSPSSLILPTPTATTSTTETEIEPLLTQKELEVKRQLLNLSSVLYFRVNVGDEIEKEFVVVASSDRENPYDLGWKENFKAFFGYKTSSYLHSTNQEAPSFDLHLYWPMNANIEKRLRSEAQEIWQERRKARQAQAQVS